MPSYGQHSNTGVDDSGGRHNGTVDHDHIAYAGQRILRNGFPGHCKFTSHSTAANGQNTRDVVVARGCRKSPQR